MILVCLHDSFPNRSEPCSVDDVTAYALRQSFAKNVVDAGTPQDHRDAQRPGDIDH